MKATEKQIEEWNKLVSYGTISEISRSTGVNRKTIMSVIEGKKVLTCNFIKVHKYFKNLKRTIKRYSETN